MKEFNQIAIFANNILSDYELLGNDEFMEQTGDGNSKVCQELFSYWDLEADLGYFLKIWHKTYLYSELLQVLMRVPAMGV